MLKELSIKNFAIIKSEQITFSSGVNVFCGDSGAGKSIIIEALNFLLGGRGDKNYIRTNESALKVLGVFDIKYNHVVKDILNNFQIDYEDEIILNRTLNASGKSEARINGEPISLSMLKEIGKELVDIYAQNESFDLLKPKSQLKMIDSNAQNVLSPNLFVYTEKYDIYKNILAELEKLGGSGENREIRLDIMKYQMEELTSADLTVGEDESLENEKRMILSSEKLKASYQNLNSYFDKGDKNISALLKDAETELLNIQRITEADDSLLERLRSIKYEAYDIFDEIQKSAALVSSDERRLEEIEDRISLIKNLKRKYANSIEGILEFLAKTKNDYEQLLNAEENVKQLTKVKNELLDELYERGIFLSEARRKASTELAKKIEGELKKIQIKNARLEFRFGENVTRENIEEHIKRDGLDSVELLFSANAGEPLKPLAKIASGGEISRFMLGVKSVTSSDYGISTMVFDEIDAGISGETALAEGEMMIDISKNKQLLVISHLIQIVATADRHFYVRKKVVEGGTESDIEVLTGEEEIHSLAKLISGEEYGDSAIEHAREIRKYMARKKAEISE